MILRRAAGIIKQYHYPELHVDVLYGKKEVISVEERLVKQILTPETAGAIALVVRNAGDTEDRVKITEEGVVEAKDDAPLRLIGIDKSAAACPEIRLYDPDLVTRWYITKRGSQYTDQPDWLVFQYFDGSTWHQVLNLIGSSDEARVRHLRPVSDNAWDLGSTNLRWANIYVANTIYLGGNGSLKNGRLEMDLWSGDYIQIGSYDPNVNGVLFYNRYNAKRLYINCDSLRINDTEVIASDRLLHNARVASVNKGGSDVTVTETSSTLKQEITPDSGFFGFAYIEGIHIVASNPSGSGATLYFEVKALLDDGTEVSLGTGEVAEGGSYDDWLRFIYDAIGNGRTVKAVRLYAYCSATPASGYEPTIRIDAVTGLQV